MSHLDQLLHVHDDGVHSEESSERVEAARGYLEKPGLLSDTVLVNPPFRVP